MRVCYDFDHKSFTSGNELRTNPEIWIVASGTVARLRYHFASASSFTF